MRICYCDGGWLWDEVKYSCADLFIYFLRNYLIASFNERQILSARVTALNWTALDYCILLQSSLSLCLECK